MNSFQYLGQAIGFWDINGVILDSQKRNETHVSSSGGGGYINQYGGHISSPTISSYSTLHHEFWLKTPDEKEVSVKLRNIDVPLRPGQRVSVLCAGDADKETGYYCTLINHNAERHWSITDAAELVSNLKLFDPSKGTGKAGLIAFVLVAFLILLMVKWWLAVASLGIVPLMLTWKKSNLKAEKKRVDGLLADHIENLVQELYRRECSGTLNDSS